METLSLYLELEKFRSDDKFVYELVADPQLLNSDFKVPPLVVQPFVENAIHHGILNRHNGGGRLMINLSLEENKIVYRIRDNGVGRLVAAQLKTGRQKSRFRTGCLFPKNGYACLTMERSRIPLSLPICMKIKNLPEHLWKYF